MHSRMGAGLCVCVSVSVSVGVYVCVCTYRSENVCDKINKSMFECGSACIILYVIENIYVRI